jgi:hypothetical protein
MVHVFNFRNFLQISLLQFSGPRARFELELECRCWHTAHSSGAGVAGPMNAAMPVCPIQDMSLSHVNRKRDRRPIQKG